MSGVLQLIDALDAGGAEQLAVNLANHLPRTRWRVHLCTTRRDGPLAAAIAPDVARLCLDRRHTLEPGPILRLVRYCRTHQIDIVHAHGTALFVAAAATVLQPRLRVVWHDHCPAMASGRRDHAYALALRRCAAVIAVSDAIQRRASERLGVAAERIRYIPNFVTPVALAEPPVSLPGMSGSRIVCVANLRERKNQRGLIAALTEVRAAAPDAHLLLVGDSPEPAYRDELETAVAAAELTAHVSFLGARSDVADILAGADVAVLPSFAEGLPMALLEYGRAALPAVVTDVGQCAAVVADGAGILVPPGDVPALVAGLTALLTDPDRRRTLGTALQQRVEAQHSAAAAIAAIERVYDDIHVNAGTGDACSPTT
jgi:glycosyltransferase involved in cell wall biosynthesis